LARDPDKEVSGWIVDGKKVEHFTNAASLKMWGCLFPNLKIGKPKRL